MQRPDQALQAGDLFGGSEGVSVKALSGAVWRRPVLPMSVRDAMRGVGSYRRDCATGFEGCAPGRAWPERSYQQIQGYCPDVAEVESVGGLGLVNVQSSLFSTSESLRCVINLAVAPEPWLRWQREQLGKGMPRSATQCLGLYRERLHPTGTPEGTDGWWDVGGAESAVAAATDMAVQLESAGWPVLGRMLSAGGMLDQVRRGDLGSMKRADFRVFFARAEALLLMDRGPSDELEESLQDALEHCMPVQKENAIQFDEWVRGQSRSAG